MDDILKEQIKEILEKKYSASKAKRLLSFIEDEARQGLDAADFNLFIETILEKD